MRTVRRKTKWFIGCAEVLANNEWKWANNKVLATFSVLLAKAPITRMYVRCWFCYRNFSPEPSIAICRHCLWRRFTFSGMRYSYADCVQQKANNHRTKWKTFRIDCIWHTVLLRFSVALRLIAWSAHMSALDIMLQLIRKRRCHSCRRKWTLNAIRNLLSHGISILLASSICAPPLKFLHAQKINISRVGVAVAVAAID